MKIKMNKLHFFDLAFHKSLSFLNSENVSMKITLNSEISLNSRNIKNSLLKLISNGFLDQK